MVLKVIKNIVTYNNDAKINKPIEQYDSVFISPPYDNLEKYDIAVDSYDSLISDTLNVTLHSSVKFIGVVVREDFIKPFVSVLGYYTSSHILNNKNSHFGKTKIEKLFIWEL